MSDGTAARERIALVEQAHATCHASTVAGLADHETRIRAIERTLWKAAGVVTAFNVLAAYLVKHIP